MIEKKIRVSPGSCAAAAQTDLPSTRRIACCSIGVRCASPLAGDLNLQKAAAAAGAARQAEVLAAGFWASGEEIIAAVARGSKERPPQCVSFFTI